MWLLENLAWQVWLALCLLDSTGLHRYSESFLNSSEASQPRLLLHSFPSLSKSEDQEDGIFVPKLTALPVQTWLTTKMMALFHIDYICHSFEHPA